MGEVATSADTFLLGALAFLIPLLATFHILLTKDDVRAAIGWVGLVWLVPFFGPLFYMLFGVNRIQRKAIRVRRFPELEHMASTQNSGHHLRDLIPDVSPVLERQAALDERVTGLPLCGGNAIEPHYGGEEAFPAMLDAIMSAQKSVALSTYIFDHDRAGKVFVEALGDAARRGVDVRVLVDGVGELYHRPSVSSMLRAAGVKVARFNRNLLPWRMAYINLRNHRKLLICDGGVGFTGGMNIREGNYKDVDFDDVIEDLHFKIEGPLVAQMMDVFAADWAFSTDEVLDGARWCPAETTMDDDHKVARGIADGPDDEQHKTLWALVSALGMAQRSVRISTPYFLPDRILITALNHAALRGVKVDIVLPEKGNLRVVSWAAQAQYRWLLGSGCRIHHRPPPFDHTKLMIVDESWVLFGSTNWDSRSLRLNFEFNVECYDDALAHRLAEGFDEKLARSKRVTKEDVIGMPVYKKLRNGVAWLFSPYL